MRLLCVEDEASLREDIAEYLRMQSYEVDEAASGEEAIDHLNARHYDLVLCDIKMPKMDGYQLLRQVRSENQLATTPFIFLTALNEKDDKLLAHDIGCDVYLTKPIDFSVLDATLRAQIERQRTRDFLFNNVLECTRRHAMAVLDDALSGPMAELALTVRQLRNKITVIEPQELDHYLSDLQEKIGKHALDMHTLHSALQLQDAQIIAERTNIRFDELIKGAIGEFRYNKMDESFRLVPAAGKTQPILNIDIQLVQRAIAELLAALPTSVHGTKAIGCAVLNQACTLTIADEMEMIGDEDFAPIDEMTNLPSLSHVVRERLVAIMLAMQVAHAHNGRVELKIWPGERLAVRFVLPQPTANTLAV